MNQSETARTRERDVAEDHRGERDPTTLLAGRRDARERAVPRDDREGGDQQHAGRDVSAGHLRRSGEQEDDGADPEEEDDGERGERRAAPAGEWFELAVDGLLRGAHEEEEDEADEEDDADAEDAEDRRAEPADERSPQRRGQRTRDAAGRRVEAEHLTLHRRGCHAGEERATGGLRGPDECGEHEAADPEHDRAESGEEEDEERHEHEPDERRR